MAIYTFFVIGADHAAKSQQAFELGSDGDARALIFFVA